MEALGLLDSDVGEVSERMDVVSTFTETEPEI
jgi:hypothetical protein